MDLNGYIDRIEASVEDPDALIMIRDQVAADTALSDTDREFLIERVGTYLADLERAGDIDIDDEGPGARPE